MKAFSFEKLTVWQKSRKLALHIYKLTSNFPNDEKYGLVSRMRRPAISISSNIAEGTRRHHSKDKARFSEMAYGSALELLNQIIVSLDLEIIDNESYNNIRLELS